MVDWAKDREDLARMIRENKVKRDATVGSNVAGARQFVAEIEAMVSPPVNLAIRPKAKKAKRRKR